MVRISPPDPHITLERRVGSLDLSPVPRSMYADLSPRWTSVNDVNGGNLPDYVGPVALLHAHGRF